MSLFSENKEKIGSKCTKNEKGEIVCTVKVNNSVGYVRFVKGNNGISSEIDRTIDETDPETYKKIADALTALVKKGGD